jgi:hypothetical protein
MVLSKKSSAKKCLVVIPTHKEQPNQLEIESFLNTISILHSWPVKVLLLEGLSGAVYLELASKAGREIEIGWARDGHMGSLENYNKMATSRSFYEDVSDFEYILIVHLDAWIFRDELSFWIDKNYDYVGAPLFLNRGRKSLSVFHRMLPTGGNGGLCLRKVKKHLQILLPRETDINWDLAFKWFIFLIFKSFLAYVSWNRVSWFVALSLGKSTSHRSPLNEDIFFSVICAINDQRFRVAPPLEALAFALEVNAEEILEFNLQLGTPFGIHGIGKYTPMEYVRRISNNYERVNRSYAQLVK